MKGRFARGHCEQSGGPSSASNSKNKLAAKALITENAQPPTKAPPATVLQQAKAPGP